MDWNSTMEDNRRMLKRIVALLFALGRPGGAPQSACLRPVRVFVLRILSPC